MHRTFAVGAIWPGLVVLCGLALGACTFDFDAPFAQSAEGGGPGATTGQGPGGGGAGGATTGGATTGGATTGSTTSSSSGDTTSSSTGPATTTVDCGDDPCTFEPGNGGCCWDDPSTAECFTQDPSNNDCRTQGAGAEEVLIECQLPEHCPDGEVCCAFDDDDEIESVRCTSDCDFSDVTLCASSDDCDGNDDCLPIAGLPDGYRGCD